MAEKSHVDRRVYQSKIKGVTKGKLFNLNYEWKIHNVNIVGKKKTEHLSSELFSSTNNDIQWQLILYPKGKYHNDVNLIVDLRFYPSYYYREIEADYKISILDNEKKNVYCRRATSIFTYRDNCWGFSYGNNSILLEHENYVPNGCLTLVCEISYCTDIKNLPNEIDEIASFIDPGFGKLQSGYKALFESQALSDVTLSVSGQELRAHKTILAAQSPVFLAMFNNDMKEKSDNRVDIKDVDFDIFHKMLQYIYTGEVEMTDDATVDGLLTVAEMYNVEALKNECQQYFCKKINVDNVIVLFGIADKYNASYLKEYTLKFMYREGLISHNIIELTETLRPDAIDLLTQLSIREAKTKWMSTKKLNWKHYICIASGGIAVTIALAFLIKKMIDNGTEKIVAMPPIPPIPSIPQNISDLQNYRDELLSKIDSVKPFEFLTRALDRSSN